MVGEGSIKKLNIVSPETLKKFIIFCAVGFFGLLVNLLVTYIFKEVFGLFYFLAFLIGVAASWTFIFFVNSLVTFNGHKKGNYLILFGKFIAGYIVLFCFNAFLVFLFTSVLNIFYLFSIVTATIITAFLTFTFSRTKIFRYK